MIDNEGWSLVALGAEGDVVLELDASGEDLSLQLHVGTFALVVDVPDRSVMTQLRDFLGRTFRTGKNLDTEVRPGVWRSADRLALHLGITEGLRVTLVKDGEHDDRYFIELGSAGRMQFAPSVEQTERLVSAASQLVSELD